jgi:hypothetical protein
MQRIVAAGITGVMLLGLFAASFGTTFAHPAKKAKMGFQENRLPSRYACH